MARVGMDVTVVRSDAAQMDQIANQLHMLVASINGSVARMSSGWHGADAEQLIHCWQRQSRPAIEAVAAHVHRLATTARNEAHAQDVTSGAAGTASFELPVKRPAAFTSGSLADPKAIDTALKNAHTRELRDAKYFPGAIAQLRLLESQMSDPPTAVQVEALNRYANLIKIADMQRATVTDAANLSIDSFKDATKSDMSVVSSAFGVHDHGAHSILQGAGKAAADGAEASADDFVQSKILDGITYRDAASIVAAYDHSADHYLTGVGIHAASLSELNRADYGSAFQSASVLDGRLAEQNYASAAGDVSHMITGDGSLAQNVMVAVPSAVPGVAGVWNGMQAAANGWHGGQAAVVGVGALKVASVDSLGSLTAAGAALGLDR